MIQLLDLDQYLNELLQAKHMPDYCPNGLQVAGKNEIQHIVTGVTACQALLDAAITQKADAVLVHHGYFWKNENPCITGIKQQRLKTLFQHDLNLFAYHLPLDLHLEYGNNIQLGKLLHMQNIKAETTKENLDLLFTGELTKNQSATEWSHFLNTQLMRPPLHIATTNKPIRRVAWCTGSAGNLLDEAIALGVDAYLTGEISEAQVHLARESNIHLFAAGHHATERYGIKALGEHLAEKFALQHHFIDIDSPI